MEDQYPNSNCVVHDDTFDWGGPSGIIMTHESDNNTLAEHERNRRNKIKDKRS